MYIVLDTDLTRLFDIDEDDVMNPITVEDYNTGEYTLDFSYPVVDPNAIVETGQIILIKDEDTGEPIGIELLSYHPSDNRFDTVSVEMGRMAEVSS